MTKSRRASRFLERRDFSTVRRRFFFLLAPLPSSRPPTTRVHTKASKQENFWRGRFTDGHTPLKQTQTHTHTQGNKHTHTRKQTTFIERRIPSPFFFFFFFFLSGSLSTFLVCLFWRWCSFLVTPLVLSGGDGRRCVRFWWFMYDNGDDVDDGDGDVTYFAHGT